MSDEIELRFTEGGHDISVHFANTYSVGVLALELNVYARMSI